MKVYTVQEVARILRVNPLTVLRLIKRGNLRARKVGRVYRITEQELSLFLDPSISELIKDGSDA
jgi:excisionase family DNA binding protein